MKRGYTVKPQVERFMSKVEPDTNGGCWLWTGSTNHNGYGAFAMTRGAMKLAHRASYLMFRGDPKGLQVCHRCDVRCCVNPDHLWLGTPAENSADAVRKGRMTGARNPLRSEESPTSKLNAEAVREIRAAIERGWSKRGLARKMGLGATTIARVVKRESWAHVE